MNLAINTRIQDQIYFQMPYLYDSLQCLGCLLTFGTSRKGAYSKRDKALISLLKTAEYTKQSFDIYFKGNYSRNCKSNICPVNNYMIMMGLYSSSVITDTE